MRYLLFIFLLCVAVAQTADAQIALPIGNTPRITLSPQFPAPGDRVTVNLEDQSGVVDQSSIDWKLGSTSLPETANARSISFVAGEAMVSQVISATLRPRTGQPITLSETVTPRYLDIIIEPQTYVPPQYPGRPLPSYASQVRVSAVLNGKNGLENPDTFNYLWKLNNTVIGGGQQRSGDQIVYTVPHGRSHTISVEISNQSGQTVARRGLTVPVSDVAVRLYEKSPLYGLSTRVIGNPVRMIGGSMTLEAVPYYLDTRALTSNLYTQWELDGRRVSAGGSAFELTLERRGQGEASAEFEVRNLSELLQGGKATAKIAF